MPNCKCGGPIYIKKSGECRRCYMRRYYREHPEKFNTPKRREAQRRFDQERAQERAEARRDTRPFEVVLLEKTEQAFIARERHLQKRRAWNARHAEQRAQYRRTYADPNKAERNRRAASKRQAELGRRSVPYALSPEQKAAKRERMRRYVEENRDRINAQNAERASSRRADLRKQRGPVALVQKLTLEDRSLIQRARIEGEPVKAIARRFNVSPAAIRYHLKRGNGAEKEATR